MTQLRQIPKIHHIPIREPMFINGVMSQAWINFFETLSKTANITYEADPIALAQKQQNLQSQIAFGALVGAVGLQNLLTMADGGELGAVAVQMGGGDVLPLTHTAPMDSFCGLPVVTILEQL